MGVAAELRGFGWAGYDVGDKLGLIWNVRPHKARILKFNLGNTLRRCKFLNISYLSEKSFEAFALSLHRFQPQFIRGHAGSVNLFASFLLKYGRFKIRPKAVFTSCETLLPHYRRTIEAAFGCKVYDYYGSVEVSHVGAQCGCGEGFHVTDENVFVEVARNGEVLQLARKAMCCLRICRVMQCLLSDTRLGILGELLVMTVLVEENYRCWRFLGRTNEYSVNRDGSFVFLKDFQTFFSDVPVTDYEVVQLSLDEIIVKIVPKLGFSHRHSDFIARNLKYVGSAKVRVELVDALRPQESGKIRHIVSKVHTDYT